MNKIEQQHAKAKTVVQEWANKKGHDRCWYYPELFRELAAIFEIAASDPCLPPRNEFEQGCRRYQEEVYADDPQNQKPCSNLGFCLILIGWFLIASGFICLFAFEFLSAGVAFFIALVIFSVSFSRG
jgi:hypothetical protein